MHQILRNKTIVVFGFGAQGRAHALNMQDSGLDITICLPESSLSIAEVKSSSFNLITNPIEAARQASIAAFMVSDTVQKNLYKEIQDALPLNSAMIFAHGFNIHYQIIRPREDLDIILAAPMAHGETVRKMYIEKTGIPTLIAVHQNVTNSAWQIAKAYAASIGATNESMIETTFREETETDLFTEQTLICGGIWRIITAAFDTLVETGYSPEIAYYCCLKETKIMSEMFASLGILKTFEKISDVARFGALNKGPRIIGKHVKEQMKKALQEIRNGKFIVELEKEMKKGNKSKTTKMMKLIASHQLEVIHKKIADAK